MTESEWLKCTDPQPMLKYLAGKASARKLRLFACACVRRVWSQLTDERSKKAVEIAEWEADRSASEDALRVAEQEAKAAPRSRLQFLGFRPSEQAAAAAAQGVVNVDAVEAARLACGWARNVRLALTFADELEHSAIERPVDWSKVKEKTFADWGMEAVTLLRCIFGNPFCPITLDPTWRTPEVVGLAGAIYSDRAFDRMPILANALESAGCHEAEFLRHCRRPGDHVRGCWVIDKLMGNT